MTADEATRIVKILRRADSGCVVCVGSLFIEFGRAFPEHRAIIDAAWKADFGDEGDALDYQDDEPD